MAGFQVTLHGRIWVTAEVKQVEGCELQIADGPNQPAVTPIRIDIKFRGFEPLLIFLDERQGIAILRCKMHQEMRLFP